MPRANIDRTVPTRDAPMPDTRVLPCYDDREEIIVAHGLVAAPGAAHMTEDVTTDMIHVFKHGAYHSMWMLGALWALNRKNPNLDYVSGRCQRWNPAIESRDGQVVFSVGEQVTWLYVPRGGYGDIVPVNAVVVKVNPKTLRIRARRAAHLGGAEAEKNVKPENVRKRRSA